MLARCERDPWMRTQYKLMTVVTAAGIFFVAETVPPPVERVYPECGVYRHAITDPVPPHPRFSDVGSRGPGFVFVKDGTINVITPAS